MAESIKNRYEFIMLYDVENGNPNGDPDAGNMPRIDPETGHGIVTDVCIKRKIRNYVELIKGSEPRFNIFVKQDNVYLNAKSEEALTATQDEQDKTKRSLDARTFMCEKYYDIRTFGAVLTAFTKKEAKLWNSSGQIRGPVQIAFGKSIDPISPSEITITRVAITDEKEQKADSSSQEGASTMFGRKHIVPYALYKQVGFVSANIAERITNFSEADLDLLWEAIKNMFEYDRSASRGVMALRRLIIFKHDNAFGCAAAHELFDLVSVERKNKNSAARCYQDYCVTISKDIPKGITVIEK